LIRKEKCCEAGRRAAPGPEGSGPDGRRGAALYPGNLTGGAPMVKRIAYADFRVDTQR
jgi:hypothetical protein